ncbi:hypothetical protein CPC16_007025 [Podila verticillata]|nr:hypothetical protein CPC16_007025 [Podila verticillata]
MELLGTHFQESARRAAGSFLSPLTNAIGEQRRLVESLAVVSKIRVEECKHMMVWSKSQTDDVGDVLLKLNLLIRKISDYEIRFGSQYEGFREKIKYLRTKDDSLCEMGRRQSDLQARILDASKSKLRSAKARLLQSELDDIQKDSAPAETELQRLKRQLIKDAYTEQLNAIIELGRKMQIIGDHGKQLLEHIDLPGTPSDGRKTEDILQSARITLESWDKLVMVNPESVVVHPPPAVSLAGSSIDQVSTLAVSEAPSDSDSSGVSDLESDDDEEEFVQAPSTPLKAKASVVSTKQPSQESLVSITTAAAVVEEASSESESEAEEEEEEVADDKEIEKPDSNLLQPFASTLAPKLTLTPHKPTSQTRPPLPARSSSDWASEATQALASVHIKKGAETKPAAVSEEETLRQQEELEMKKALELSLVEPQPVPEESNELKLTAEEIRFVMGDISPKRSTKVAKRQARAPETTDGDSPAVISAMRRATRRAQKEAAAINNTSPLVDTHIETTDTESEEDEEKTPTAQAPRVRGPQLSEASDTIRVSQQGPRPWNPEEAVGAPGEDTKEVPEELASATDIPETMGDKDVAKPSEAAKVIESMGPEPEKPLESMGPEPEKPLESMGPEPERTLESMGHDGPDDEPVQEVPFVAMPQMPSLDRIREQKIQERMHQERIQQQRQSTYAPSPELQFLPVQNSPQPGSQQVHMSPQPMNQKAQPGSGHSSANNSPRNSTYQSPIGYQPATSYVPSPKQKNRLSGSHTPPQGAGSPGSSPQPQYQQQYQQQYQSSTYSAEYLQHQHQQQLQYLKQQQQQLQDFYYLPHEQEYQQQQYQQYHQQLRQHQRMDSVSSVSSIGSNIGIAPLGWNLPGMAPPQVNESDLAQYSAHHYQQHHHHASQQQQQQQQPVHDETSSDSQSTGAPSPSPSHISLISEKPQPPLPTVAPLKPKKTPLAPNPDDYKVEVK